MGWEPKNSACAEREPQIEDLLSEELHGAERERLVQHIQDCAGCTAAFESAKLSQRLLRVAGPSQDPGPAFTRMVLARIRTEQQASGASDKKYWQPLVAFASRFAISATLALGLLVAYGTMTKVVHAPSVASLGASQPSEIFPDPSNAARSRDDVMLWLAENNHGKQ